MRVWKKLSGGLLVIIMMLGLANPAWAFCGFYVAKADATLYNKASQVIIARDGNRTVLTMANDYQGEVKNFALVVPVPVVLNQEQVHVTEGKIIERLDGFSAPRLVEYFDQNPCAIYERDDRGLSRGGVSRQAANAPKLSARNSLGVTIEKQFSVGEYDILILSAKDSNGLETWLKQNGYKIPSGASEVLHPYIQQGMKFFVAKVNLKEFSKTGFQSLRPLQMAYESPKFMLPIRLGMVNGKGEQDLIVYLLSPKGQPELTSYRTVKVPSDVDIPEFVQKEYQGFYKAMFKKAYNKEGRKVAFLEYAWDMGNCDPCSAEPLNPEELRKAGVFWLNSNVSGNTFITRLHVRYTRDKFPEDLQFQETANRQSFQGRYVIHHPFKETVNCSALSEYKRTVKVRQEKEAQTLAQLTGWNLQEIRQKVDFVDVNDTPWWRRLWN